MSEDNCVRTVLEKLAEERNYSKDGIKLEEVSTEGANYTSALFHCILQDEERDDLEVFAKVSLIDKQADFAKVNIFETERFFYQDILPVFNDLYDKFSVPQDKRMIFPEFVAYADIANEILMLEDIRPKGYKLVDRFKSVSWELADKSFEELAKFHALSFAMKELRPSDFKNIESKNLKADLSTAKKMTEHLQSIAIQTVADKNKERLSKFLKEQPFEKLSIFYDPMEGCPAVLVHGDYRQSNLMYKRENGKISLIPLDYQLVHPGRASTDLIYFIITSTDQEFRRQHYNRLIDLYYQYLTQALKMFEIDVNEVFPKAIFLEEFHDSLKFAVYMSILILPFVTFDPEDVPSLESLMSMQANVGSQYPERLNEVIDDLVTWGVL